MEIKKRGINMREIIFRGKRLTNGEWVYGSLIQCNGEASIWSEGLKDDVAVDPETVGQFVSVFDKNKRMVFEGDICAIYLWDGSQEYCEGIFAVKWCEANAMFELVGRLEDLEFGLISNCEVIGNIYDNPDLSLETEE